MREIELFVPYKFEKSNIDENTIDRMFGKSALYVSKGRYAITHILNSFGIRNGRIAISAYMCPSVRETLLQKGFEVVYYDVDSDDLNADIKSVEIIIDEEKPKAIVIASMYGNPANLADIERLCREKGVKMIDDAAQSFGAKLGNHFVGSFGDGGFFSFSPGKPTAAHRGAYFWTSEKYEIKRTRHFVYALVTYKDFKYRRYLAYENHPIKRTIWSLIALAMSRIPINIEKDLPEAFERNILGGAFDTNIGEAMFYRKKWSEKFSNLESKKYRFIKGKRGISNNCKLVYLASEKFDKDRFADFLTQKGVAFYEGYKIPHDAKNVANICSIEGRIIELPIDFSEDKMNYLYGNVKEFFNQAGG